MRLLNYREGFACNSSSTHSIVFAEGDVPGDSLCDDLHFGWQPFIASSPEKKMHWLGAQLFRQLISRQNFALETAAALVRDWVGVEATEDFMDSDYSVDHQSAIIFPESWSGHGLDRNFILDLKRYLLDPRALVFGGNDNDDDLPSPPRGRQVFYRGALPVDGDDRLAARKDSSGYWTLFSRTSGRKCRVVLDPDNSMSVIAKKADAPELVDLKITDFCPYDCEFCYQDSTRRGGHAPYMGGLYGILAELADMRVFEVAIGGGEPTLHPEFTDIVTRARELGIVPNFTTRNPGWVISHPELLDVIGGFALSCDSLKELEQAAKVVANLPKGVHEKMLKRMTVQHVLGLQKEYDTQTLVNRLHELFPGVPLTFLGYKTTGRGQAVRPHVPYDKKTWGEWIRDMWADPGAWRERPPLRIDTLLVPEVEAWVPKHYLTRQEGQFSCYVDAVRMRLHASSFDLSDGIPFKHSYHARDDAWTLEEAWRRVSAYSPEGAYDYRHGLPVIW